MIAQCLSAAQRTVPSNFTIHSMHCYFVLAGDADIPVMYYVEHVREGKSYATRTVQARQRGRCIFTTTMSFTRENSGGLRTVQHAVPIPGNIRAPSGQDDAKDGGPFVSEQIDILNGSSNNPHEKRTRQWIRARGSISPEGGHQAHLSALAYMSDSYFIGTVARIHGLWRYGTEAKAIFNASPIDVKTKQKVLNKMKQLDGFGNDLENEQNRPEVGMMVSLDHTIYFHEPRKFRADEWMFSDMCSPWSGDGRGLVMQHIFTKDGTLVATCVQEVCMPPVRSTSMLMLSRVL